MEYKNNIVVFSLIAFFLFYFKMGAQNQQNGANFILKGTVTYEEKPLVGVLFELTKNDELITKLNSSKNGKFNIKILQNTVDTNSNYLLTISKIGFVTKILNINTYIPLSDYDDNSFVYTLDVELLATSITNVVIQRPFGKIKWDSEKQLYDIDQVYYRAIYKEEQLLKDNPDQYLKEMLTKQNKANSIVLNEDETPINNTAQKKDLDTVTAIQKQLILITKQDTVKQVVENIAKDTIIKTVKEIVLKKNIVKQSVKKQVIKKEPINKNLIDQSEKIEAVKKNNSDQDFFDEELIIYMKNKRNQMENLKIKMNNNRAENISNKYETSNILTSLMDVVDIYEKNATK